MLTLRVCNLKTKRERQFWKADSRSASKSTYLCNFVLKSLRRKRFFTFVFFYTNSKLKILMASIQIVCWSLIILLTISVNALEPSDVVIVVLSQKEGYHAARANILRKSIQEQADTLEKESPEVILTHELNINGSWTIVPLLTYLSSTYINAKWFFYCLENTVIKLDKMVKLLSKFNTGQDIWLGHALYDHEPTIIHHFADHKKKFKYPHVASGFAISSRLMHSLTKEMSIKQLGNVDFSIDASYEFANFVLKNSKDIKLTHVPEICIVSGSDCATYPRFFHPCSLDVSSDNVYFAVKTCSKYHTERISVIKQTWTKHVKHIGYFSDLPDRNLPEAYTVPNTTQGHCAKTYGILKQANDILKNKKIDWLVISDDDTIFSVARLLRLLTCYNPKHPVAIGERYGFRLWYSDDYGYEYLTGGAGVVLSAPLVEKMVQPGICECPTSTTPDDMYLFGICLQRLGIHPTHCPMFHQARPTDYATAFLASQDPISFHKFWMIDPKMVYEEWFAEADTAAFNNRHHTEL